jgi:hypothetical protein
MVIAVLLPGMSWAETFKIKTVANGSGRIISETGVKTVEAGGDLRFTFEPKSNAVEVRDVKVDGVSAGVLSEYTFTDVASNHRLVVVFKKKIFTVAADVQGDAQGGTLRPSGELSALYGSTKSFRARPPAGLVAGLFVDGSLVKEGLPGRPVSYKLKRITDHHVVSAMFYAPGDNHPPVAAPLSRAVALSVPYMEAQLIGLDADDDTLSYELTGTDSGSGVDWDCVGAGTGYLSACAHRDTGLLNVELDTNFQGTIEIPYRVTDGKQFSAEALVTVTVQALDPDKGTGGQEIDPKTYAGFDRTRLSSNLLGSTQGQPTEPESVDLSANFPVPGDQGRQGSCVAWATGYALKSYQEGVEMNWSLNTPSHLFSPAYIYNQVNGGQDNGSQIYDALDLIIGQGAATLDLMPYTDQNFTNQPSAAAKTAAAKFKGVKRYTISSLSDLKGALAQRKPVVLGIEVFDQFYQLKGPNSVYNSKAGSNTGQHGRHAVTAVGYDNAKFGGAVKVINSWSTGWGDNGFFWMPYSFFPEVTFQMWVLDDGPNGDITPTPDPVPPPSNDLPDLQVVDWNATFDTNIGGSGQLAYEVKNGGQGTVPTGATVAFVLSKDDRISAADTYVVYEQIPFDLGPGDPAFRCFNCPEDNAIGFDIPVTLEPGVYYLGLLVDDLNAIPETDETNNDAVGSGTATFANSSGDLEVYTWYASWDGFGDGSLTYRIDNIGGATVPAGWRASLILSDSEFLGDPFTSVWWLASDPIGTSLPAGSFVSHSGFGTPFNVYNPICCAPLPAGTYYMAFVADDEGVVAETDELNNVSFSYSLFYNLFGARREAALSQPVYPGIGGGSVRPVSEAYNGRKLPGVVGGVRRVRIGEDAGGARTIALLPEANDGPVVGTDQGRKFSKTLQSADKTVFPSLSRKPLPAVTGP